MDLIKWDSLLNLDSLFKDMPSADMVGWDLATDIYEQNGNIVVEIQLPGIGIDKYDISTEGNMLVVKGFRKKEEETEDKNYYRQEIQRGNFERRVMLPDVDIDKENITTKKEDGVLKINIPKK